ncbi:MULTISPECIES: cupin domain-containing protein [unclassified Paraburkholderia]|uniref:cupin domain-containing protein n=1 Tax=unclassified Paraburkholderia TaxID=2615204 RepID=UPI002AB2CF42|nr:MULTISPECIES: cupin domain-containing protein [unclassified Paraburkholderia]
MSVNQITPLSAILANEPQVSPTPAAVLLSGNGDTKTWPALVTTDGVVTSGIWESEAFSKKKSHPDSMEFCYILEGTVEISDNAGNAATYGPGEAFIVQPGFNGVWTSATRVRKYFVIAKCQPAQKSPNNKQQASHEQVL